jgi:hypothetical protein
MGGSKYALLPLFLDLGHADQFAHNPDGSNHPVVAIMTRNGQNPWSAEVRTKVRGTQAAAVVFTVDIGREILGIQEWGTQEWDVLIQLVNHDGDLLLPARKETLSSQGEFIIKTNQGDTYVRPIWMPQALDPRPISQRA